MTGPTSEGSVSRTDAYIAFSSFKMEEREKGKDKLKIEEGNYGDFGKRFGPEGILNLKTGLSENLKNNKDVKKYKESQSLKMAKEVKEKRQKGNSTKNVGER